MEASPMTPTEFKQARQSLGLSPEEAATLLGYGNRSRVYEIEGGSRRPSKAVLLLLEAYLAGYRPEGWP